MAFCVKCGTDIDWDTRCPKCGYQKEEKQVTPVVEDKGGFLYFLLGACIPIVGLILFITWSSTKPKSAKAAGLGALMILPMIVFFGIISAFAIPAVGSIIDNTEKATIYQDALTVENAMKIHCIDLDCSDDEDFTWNQLSPYITSFNEALYEMDGDTLIGYTNGRDFFVNLERKGTGDYEFPNDIQPTEGSRDDVRRDTD